MVKKKKWGVWEPAAGKLWTVNPPTKKNAEKEAKLASEYYDGEHLVVPVTVGRMLKNAYAHGRSEGYERGLRF